MVDVVFVVGEKVGTCESCGKRLVVRGLETFKLWAGVMWDKDLCEMVGL